MVLHPQSLPYSLLPLPYLKHVEEYDEIVMDTFLGGVTQIFFYRKLSTRYYSMGVVPRIIRKTCIYVSTWYYLG